jgi:RHS repeat-associated protein
VGGGNAVAEKRVDFAYNAAGQYTSIVRYKDLSGGGGDLAAETSFTYDGIGRLTDLTHFKGTVTFADYDWDYDEFSRVISMTFSSLVGNDGSTTYTYDDTNQLTGADHDYQTDESYEFDENGNRTMSGYSTGDNNRMLSDGVFDYTYDDEGNRISRTRISSDPADDKTTEYEWDQHNRLTKVTYKNNGGTVTKEVEYTYDVYGRRIKKSIDWDGAGAGDPDDVEYVYGQEWDILLAFTGDSSLTNRYLHGPGEDNVLADEQFQPTTPAEMPTAIGDLFWMLVDEQGTLRDVVDTDGSNVVNHITYDAFGKVTSETTPAQNHLSGFQGAERDEETGTNHHNHRDYDPATGRWLKEDEKGFGAGDTNLARFVGNDPSNGSDPTGLEEDEGINDAELRDYAKRWQEVQWELEEWQRRDIPSTLISDTLRWMCGLEPFEAISRDKLNKVEEEALAKGYTLQMLKAASEDLIAEGVIVQPLPIGELAPSGAMAAGTPRGSVGAGGRVVGAIRTVDPKTVINALKGFRSSIFKTGGHSFLLDRRAMTHILKRHHPQFWDGTTKATQSFFPKNMTTDQISCAIKRL